MKAFYSSDEWFLNHWQIWDYKDRFYSLLFNILKVLKLLSLIFFPSDPFQKASNQKLQIKNQTTFRFLNLAKKPKFNKLKNR